MMYDNGWRAIHHPALEKLIQSQKLPCCSLVAAWVLTLLDEQPDLDDAHKQAAWASDRALWARLNLWEGYNRFENIDAAQELLGGSVEFISMMPGKDAPKLTQNRWHIIQRWKESKGHNYLVYSKEFDVNLNNAIVVQSDEQKGFRVSEGTWSKSAGLEGYDVAVLHLPNL